MDVSHSFTGSRDGGVTVWMFLIPLRVVGMRGGEGFDCMDVSHSFKGSRDDGGGERFDCMDVSHSFTGSRDGGVTVWMFLIPLRVVGMRGGAVGLYGCFSFLYG